MYRRSLDEVALRDIQIIVGRDGLTSQMNYIRRFFPAGTVILGCNDLLADVVQKIDERDSTPMPAGMLLHWAHHAHSMMQRYGVSLCGLAPSNCLLKMHISHISQKFGLVNGSLYLEINQRNPSLLCKGSGLIWGMEHTCRFRKSHGPALRYLTLHFANTGSQGAIPHHLFLRMHASLRRALRFRPWQLSSLTC